MEGMRELLRKELGRSLQGLPELDRLQAGWAVVCGKAMSARGRLARFEGGIAVVEAEDVVWLGEMLSMRGVLESELARVAGVKLGGIHFCLRQDVGSRRE